MALISVVIILHRQVFGDHGIVDLVGLRLFDSRIVGALPYQQRHPAYHMIFIVITLDGVCGFEPAIF